MVPWRDRRGKLLVMKPATLAAACVPGLLTAIWWAEEDLGARPVTEAIHETGLWAIRFLLIALAVTPFRAVFDWGKLLLVRRMLGLTALAYAIAHFSLYIVQQNGHLLFVASEIVHRFYLTIGFVTLLGLIALGVTSTNAAIRRMGAWWKRLHRLAYPLGAIALLHYFIQSKANVSEPVFVAGLYVWLMLWRACPRPGSGPGRCTRCWRCSPASVPPGSSMRGTPRQPMCRRGAFLRRISRSTMACGRRITSCWPPSACRWPARCGESCRGCRNVQTGWVA